MTYVKRQIRAVTEAGDFYIINEIQHQRRFTPLNGIPQKMDTTIEYITECGEHVNRHRDGSFRLVMTDEVLSEATA